MKAFIRVCLALASSCSVMVCSVVPAAADFNRPVSTFSDTCFAEQAFVEPLLLGALNPFHRIAGAAIRSHAEVLRVAQAAHRWLHGGRFLQEGTATLDPQFDKLLQSSDPIPSQSKLHRLIDILGRPEVAAFLISVGAVSALLLGILAIARSRYKFLDLRSREFKIALALYLQHRSLNYQTPPPPVKPPSKPRRRTTGNNGRKKRTKSAASPIVIDKSVQPAWVKTIVEWDSTSAYPEKWNNDSPFRALTERLMMYPFRYFLTWVIRFRAFTLIKPDTLEPIVRMAFSVNVRKGNDWLRTANKLLKRFGYLPLNRNTFVTPPESGTEKVLKSAV